MSWSATFREQLAATQQSPLFRFQVIADGTTTAEGVGGSFVAGSYEYSIPYYSSSGGAATGLQIGASIVAGSVSVTSQSVQLQSWSSTLGAFSVQIAGDSSELYEKAPRGALCRLLMGFDGMAAEDFEPVAIGVVQNVRGIPGIVTVECWDLLSALKSRITTDSTKLPLYSEVPATTTLASGYSAGATSLVLTSATGFERETGGSGVVKVTPNTGDPFYLKFTNIVGSTLTVEATASFGTTAADASAGNAAVSTAYLSGHPLVLLEKTLASTGAGTNGARDTLPQAWGYGISADWIDTGSLDNWRSEVLQAASGAYTWDVLIDAPIDDGLSFWAGLLATAGMWPTVRQGKLCARACQDITSGGAKLHTLTITDDDIVSIDSYEAYDSTVSAEAGKTKVIPATASDAATASATTLSTLPGVDQIEHDLSAVVWGNQAAIVTADSDRLKIWDQRIGERIGLTLAGLKASQFVPGDVTTLTSTRLTTRLGAVSGDGYIRNRRAMIVAVSPDLMGVICRVTLVLMPTAAEESP